MRSEVPIHLLKPHPKNQDYFSGLPADKYAEIKRSIEAHGIRDPLKVLPDYTVVAGHQRLRIAQELGLDKVPVVVLDIPPEEAEYLLIADNEERRQADDDPVRKAKRAKFLTEYWMVRLGRGGDKKSNDILSFDMKKLEDVAEAIGKDERTTQRLLKLNDLIAPLQSLVSRDRLSQTAAYSLAFLPPEEQEGLLDVLGSSGVCGLSVKDAQKLRAEMEAARAERDDLHSRLAALDDEKKKLSGQLADLQDHRLSTEEQIAEKLGHRYEEKLQEALSGLQRRLEQKQAEADDLRAKLKEIKQAPVQKIVEKIIYQTDPALEAELEAARKQAAELSKEKEWLQTRFQRIADEKEKKEVRLRLAEDKSLELEKHVEHFKRELNKLQNKPRPKLDQKRVNFHALIEKASGAALALDSALKSVEQEYGDELVSAARVRGGHEIEEIATSILDAGAYKMLTLALEIAAGRIDRTFGLLQPGKPNLRVVPPKADK